MRYTVALLNINYDKRDPSTRVVKREFEHVEIRENGWLICFNGVTRQNGTTIVYAGKTEEKWYPPAEVVSVDVVTDVSAR